MGWPEHVPTGVCGVRVGLVVSGEAKESRGRGYRFSQASGMAFVEREAVIARPAAAFLFCCSC